jgi:hypothetical protein
MTVVGIRLGLAVAIGIFGIVIIVRVCLAAAAAAAYAESIPGLALGGLFIAFAVYRIALAFRMRGMQRP